MSEHAALLTEADRHALLDAVQRWADGALGAWAARPEQPMGSAQLAAALQQLGELGLVPAATPAAPLQAAASGCGLWDEPADVSLQRWSVEALTLLARVAPAVAYQAHGLALGARLDRRHGVTGPPAVPLLDGHWGIGRQALARALAGAALAPDDVAWLADCWAVPRLDPPAAARIALAPLDWSAVWWPQWAPDQGWRWCRAARAELAVQAEPHQHGLDELQAWRLGVAAAPAWQCEPAAAAGFIDIAALHGLGLLAITLGATQRAVGRARAFASLRRQGGQAIGAHAAVRQLLAEAEHALWATQAALATLQALPPGLALLHAVWRARARLQPQLSEAASHALQVFGGIGYMRDTGAEKDLRDVNTLRQLGGSPAELTLCCAALDALRDEVPT